MSLSISPDEIVADGEEREGREGNEDTAGALDHARLRQRARVALLSRALFAGGVVATIITFACAAWARRWIADDGLIVLRTVRNLMAGNGPVFNAGDRVETNTSAAWTYVIWFFSWLTHARLEYVSLFTALTLSLLAVLIGMIGAARLWGDAATQLLLPAGAVVYIAVPPARDFATSGLENCLVIFWLSVLWYLLLRWSQAERPRLATFFGLVFWAGLCWVVRPEMTIVGGLTLVVVFLAPMPATRVRPIVMRAAIVVLAGVVPVGYQIWRMGYYGLLFPNTAVAKEAGGAKWGQGFKYLWDLVGPYWLWAPLLVLLVVSVLLLRSRRSEFDADRMVRVVGDDSPGTAAAVSRWDRLRRIQPRLRTPRAVVALMLFCDLLLIIFELRVGGDFMHGRMLLPQLFILTLPVAVIPVWRFDAAGRSVLYRNWALALPVVWVVLMGWALFAANTTGNKAGYNVSADGIVDERIYYVLNSGHDHPVLAKDYLDYPRMRAMVDTIDNTPDGGLLLNSPSYMMWWLVPPPLPIPPNGAGHTVFFLNLGMTSMNVPLNVRVVDQEGLAYPLGAHTDRLTDGRIGHDKDIYSDWVVADTGMVARHPWIPYYMDDKWIEQARTAESCPATQALLASERGPLTFSRFRHNVRQSLAFSEYRIDRVPKYEIQRCHLIDPDPEPAPPPLAPPK